MLKFLSKLSLEGVLINFRDRETDSLYEGYKIDVLRILLGLVMIYRWWFILQVSAVYADYTIFPFSEAGADLLRSVVMFGLSILFALGLFTPLVTAVLVGSYITVAKGLPAWNLGDCILVGTLACMLFNGAGQLISIDSWLSKRSHVYRKLVKILYVPFGFPSLEKRTVYYFIVFLTYALISFGALLFHIQDDYWLEGETTRLLLLNPYLNPMYSTFRYLDSLFPFFFEVFSRAASVKQTFFQVFMIPLIFAGFWPRMFVVVYGYIFFTISVLFLNISYLPYIELVMWTMIFVPGRILLAPVAKYFKSINSVLALREPKLFFYLLPIIFYSVINGYFLYAKLPLVSQMIGIGASRSFDHVLALSGYSLPNVFNKNDLATATTWFTAVRILENGEEELVPIHDINGGRLFYYKADNLYFGYLTKWRRRYAQSDIDSIKANHEPGTHGYSILERLLSVDQKFQKKNHSYRVDIWRDNSMDLSLAPAERYKKSHIISVDFSV